MARVLITGAAGFIGSNLVASLARRETSGLIICDWLGNEEKWRNVGKYEISDFVHPENPLVTGILSCFEIHIQ